jgi:hypothetical protein
MSAVVVEGSLDASSEWGDAWTGALLELELDVARVESLLQSGQLATAALPGATWSPRPGLGPLPVDLHAQAAAILDRQLRAAEQLSRQIVENRRQTDLTTKLGAGDARERPVFFDRTV